MKDGFVRLLSRSGRNRATIKLLTREDEELSRILSARGWWILPRDINGPVKRNLIQLEHEGKADQIDGYLCSLFSRNDWARLRERIEKWFDLSYFADRKQIVLDGFEAHKAAKWTLTVPTLLPLVDGVTRKFSKEHLRPSKNPNQVLHDKKFAAYYRRRRPKLFGKSLANFIATSIFGKFDFDGGIPPIAINRHGVLHGEIFDYATEANSLNVFLLLDTISQFIQTVERRRKTSAARKSLALVRSQSESAAVNSR